VDERGTRAGAAVTAGCHGGGAAVGAALPRRGMETLKKLDLEDNWTQLVVAVVVIASCTLVARLFDEPKPHQAAAPAVSEAAAGSPASAAPMQVVIEGLPDNPPRALAGALKASLGLEATPVVVAKGSRAVVRLATMSDFRRCSPQTLQVMVSARLPVVPRVLSVPSVIDPPTHLSIG